MTREPDERPQAHEDWADEQPLPGQDLQSARAPIADEDEFYSFIDERRGTQQTHPEPVVVVGLNTGSGRIAEDQAQRSLDELAELAEACGAVVLGQVIQNRERVDVAYYLGSGKLGEVATQARALGAETLIFDDELSGSQLRNIEAETGLKILDRTLIILDIFARRATTREGKLQVELAQYEYRLSRLAGLGSEMSRLAGGIGTRGPGESQLETDRRHIRARMATLRRQLAGLGERRERVRRKRARDGVQIVAVVGYTNAGKSSLINRLSASELYVMDQVFATLDPTARRLELEDGSALVLIDTVGFIRRLPHQLVEAFQSTMEELRDADLILQITDAADPDALEQIAVVEAQLVRLEVADRPRIHALNKADLLPDGVPAALLNGRASQDRATLAISVVTGEGIDELLTTLADFARRQQRHYRLTLPYAEASLLSYIQTHASGIAIDYGDDGVRLDFHLDRRLSGPVERWLTDFANGD